MRMFILTAALFFVATGSASALTIDVTGVPGSGTSVWTFSGTSSPSGLSTAAQADGAFDLGSSPHPGLNLWQGGFTPTDFGPFNATDVAFIGTAPAPLINGSLSGAHVLEGFSFLAQCCGVGDRFAWWADGAFGNGETLTYSGTATAEFEITTLTGIVGVSDASTVTSSGGTKGALTMNFTAVPEPSTALLLGLGLTGLAGKGRERNRS